MVSTKTVYLNGQYLPVEQATVSVLDRGFLFGDGVYEVIPVYGAHPLRVDEHMTRLQNSLKRIGMANPLTTEQWKKIFTELLEKNPGDDRAIYLQVTRGAAPVRDLTIPDDITATVFVMVSSFEPVSIAQLEQGTSAVTMEDFRWHACDIKSISLIANVMLRRQANEQNVGDAILVRDGHITEGTASNVFVVKDNVLMTPPKSRYLLPGITRDLVLELAEHNGVVCEVRDIAETELTQADELWLTSSTREIAPVVRLNGQALGDGQAGPLWRKMIAVYQQYKQQLRQA